MPPGPGSGAGPGPGSGSVGWFGLAMLSEGELLLPPPHPDSTGAAPASPARKVRREVEFGPAGAAPGLFDR